MLKKIHLIILLLCTTSAFGATYVTVQDGPWSDNATWQDGNVPDLTNWQADNVQINHHVTIPGSPTLEGQYTLNINEGGVLDIASDLIVQYGDFTLNIDGELITGGNVTFNQPVVTGDAKLTIGGSVLINGAEFTPSYLDGSIGQDFEVISSATLMIDSGFIAIGRDYLVNGGSSIIINADMDITNDFSVNNGPTTVFNGKINIDGSFEKVGGSSISFYDNVDIAGPMNTTGGSGTFDIYVDSAVFVTAASYSSDNDVKFEVDGFFDITSGSLSLVGNSNIQGSGEVGWDSFTSSGGGYIRCVNGNEYDANPESSEPYPPANPLNLSTCKLGTLPVKFVYFKGSTTFSGVILNWSTAYEEDNDYFIIEKSSDGQRFREIGTVEGAGFSSGVTNYSFTDTEVMESGAYYRIKQVDFNGDSTTTNIIYLDLANETTGIYPNPVTGSKIFFKNADSYTSYSIISASGIVVQEEAVIRENRNNGIDVSGLQPGLYIFTASGKSGTFQKKFIRK